ncbi:MAG TPA: thioredoxin [Dehalococcoidia bacterium]|nr:thioredoxin [Dehalococcoidia bacterium]
MPELKHRLLILLLMLICFSLLLPGCGENTDLTSTSLKQAISNGKPTLAEFGRGVCISCKEMKPILEELSVEYKGELNVVIVEVDDNIDLTRQFGIMMIPTQIFLDSEGEEVFRHIGFYPKEEIIAQLEKMGIE